MVAGSPMRQQWKAVGSYGTVGLEIVLSILLGLFIGQWLDSKLGTEPLFAIFWFFAGLAAGGKAIWRTWKDMQAEAAREEREQGNPAPRFEGTREREVPTHADDARKTSAAEDDRWTADDSADRSDGATQPVERHDER
jgi:ATP synthase protein I